jgi:hypothetical protein
MSLSPETQTQIGLFQADLAILATYQIVQKHILLSNSFVLTRDIDYALRAAVADHFELRPEEVYIVGSAKLGFSIAPDKRYKPFHDRSDIDIAIASERLFDHMWHRVLEYWNETKYWTKFSDFKHYLFRGWIRPDMLPPSRKFVAAQNWWDFFQELTQSRQFGPYKIRAGLYKSADFLQVYQSDCVNQCKTKLGVSL